MKVAVTGSSGLIGTALVASLRADGHEVIRLVRRTPRAADEVRWDPRAAYAGLLASGPPGSTALAGLSGCVQKGQGVLPETAAAVPSSLRMTRPDGYNAKAEDWKGTIWACSRWKPAGSMHYQLQWQSEKPFQEGVAVAWIDSRGDGNADRALSFRATMKTRGKVELSEVGLAFMSGVALDETDDPLNPSDQMFAHDDMAGFAVKAPLIAAPGTRWAYSSATTQILARIVREGVGGPGAKP